MSQLSLFSADARPLRLSDLAGLLCGPALITRFGAGDTARISLSVADAGRAGAIRAAAAPFGIRFELGERSCAGRELRTAYRRDLAGFARVWTGRDGRKTVPAGFQLDGAALRLWVLASGRPDGRGGYVLPLDGAAAGTHDALIAAMTRLGLPPARIVLPPCAACRERAPESAFGHDDAPDTAAHAHLGTETRAETDHEPVVPNPPGGRTSSPPRSRPTPATALTDGPLTDGTLTDGTLTDGTVTDGPLTDGTAALDRPPTTPPAPLAAHCRTHHLALVPAAGPECRAAGPALRIAGARRLQRLVELVGPAPEIVDTAEWPRHWGRSRA